MQVEIKTIGLDRIEKMLGGFAKRAPSVLFNVVNRVASNIRKNLSKEVLKKYGIKSADVKKTVTSKRASACSMHFRTEESYMLEFDYPDYDIHKKGHDNALLNYKTYLDQGTDNHTMDEIATALVDYIECLFTDHYSNEDVKMADFLKQTQFAVAE